MDNSERIEQLRFVINRFDHFAEGANSKGNFLLAFCGFLFGFIATNFQRFVEINGSSFEKLTSILLIITLVLGLSSIILIILAVSPFLKNNNSSKENYHSLIFFNSIVEMKEKEFTKKVKKQTQKVLLEDLSKQTHIISKGLKSKYSKIKWSLRILIIQLIFVLTVILIKTI